ncbi:MAG: NAD(P)-dependent oxidoreductase [Alphaproteobacteria bacterium]|nr:NAD(P)-dependent oxidoreductase [Alphaproteobacteria bacterium]
MAKVAFLGIGNMGLGMARRLTDAGHRLSVWNRTAAKAKPLADAGARVAASPREAAEGAEAVFGMVADDNASRAVWLGKDGALSAKTAPRAFAIECSTLSHDFVLELAKQVQAKGLRYIDCPVTGVPAMAAKGELMLLVGADKAELAAAEPLLKPLCTEIIHFGAIGTGTVYKLLGNTMGAVQIAALAEGLLIAEAAGLDMKTVDYAISKGAMASRQVVRNAGFMTKGVHEPRTFSGALRHKDAQCGLALAKKLGVRVPIYEAGTAAFTRQIQAGLGDENESRVIDAMRGK